MMEELDDQKSTQGVDDYWAMVVRRKWWILGPLFFGWLLVFASAWVIPAKYASESVVLVEPPKVPKDLVAPNVQVDLADRVQSYEHTGPEPHAPAKPHRKISPVPQLCQFAG